MNIRSREQIQWSDFEGRPSSEAIQKPFDFILQVKSGAFKVSARDVVFRQPEYYFSGEIHHHYEVWDHILTGCHKREKILKYVSEGVSVYDFFQHFKGDFKGKAYNSDIPPKAIFENKAILWQV